MTVDARPDRSTGGDGFEQDPPPERWPDDDAFLLRLDSYEGPIDVLLDQARDQKVDLTQISILALAEQYLVFIERARSLRLELAADYLVMAAWLAYLKSRLLLPEKEVAPDDEPTGEELAAALQFQLRRLEAMRKAGQALDGLPRLGRDVFMRGLPEPDLVIEKPVYRLRLYDLLRAYADHRRRSEGQARLEIQASRLYSMDKALERLTVMLGEVPHWTVLSAFLPARSSDPLVTRSQIAATFAATLELARDGVIELRQEQAFGPLFVRSVAGAR